MKKLILFILLLSVAHVCPVSAKSNQKQVLNTLEDIFSFENIDQLTRYFGSDRVYTELSYSGDPNNGGKGYLFSQVNFGTPHSVLVIWNREGNVICEVQTSTYFYDFDRKKIKMIPNQWKTKQGIHAGMHLSELVSINWFPMFINIEHEPGNSTYGHLIHRFGWIRKNRNDPYSDYKLIYTYAFDLKRIRAFYPQSPVTSLKTNSEIVRKWNPILELVTIYREGLKPER